MKAILVINEMPKSCAECPLFFGDDECYLLKEYMPTMYEYSKDGKFQEAYLFPYKEKRLNWCPLKPMPEAYGHTDLTYKIDDWIDGWNDCIDWITEGKE